MRSEPVPKGSTVKAVCFERLGRLYQAIDNFMACAISTHSSDKVKALACLSCKLCGMSWALCLSNVPL